METAELDSVAQCLEGIREAMEAKKEEAAEYEEMARALLAIAEEKRSDIERETLTAALGEISFLRHAIAALARAEAEVVAFVRARTSGTADEGADGKEGIDEALIRILQGADAAFVEALARRQRRVEEATGGTAEINASDSSSSSSSSREAKALELRLALRLAHGLRLSMR